MHQIQWGIIGCGNVTERKSGPAFGKVSGSSVVAVMRRDLVKAEDYALRHHIPNWYTNAAEIINHPDINAVYIATPPSTHAEYAIRVMESGKAAYVEKPMAASYSECISMAEVAAKTKQPLYVAYYRRFLPYFGKVKEIIDSGRLGELLYASIDFHISPRAEDFRADTLPWRVDPGIAGAGYFYDLACHQLDLFDWFFGNVIVVNGSTYNRRGLYKAEDLVFARLQYASGLPVNANWCFVARNSEHKDVIRIFGTMGTLEFSTFDFTPVKLSIGDQTEEFMPDNPENIQYWFIKNMVEELQGPVRPGGNYERALQANRVMDIILGKSA